ncbi:hypothetical protein LIER_08585 [Lithospermum erythrorhizon]|uniref:Uncharacterized protein n=1 Tax=Lithospermum erythrorhizon TaxID=34254 RepID=A0AAV3PCQ9_LITER
MKLRKEIEQPWLLSQMPQQPYGGKWMPSGKVAGQNWRGTNTKSLPPPPGRRYLRGVLPPQLRALLPELLHHAASDGSRHFMNYPSHLSWGVIPRLIKEITRFWPIDLWKVAFIMLVCIGDDGHDNNSGSFKLNGSRGTPAKWRASRKALGWRSALASSTSPPRPPPFGSPEEQRPSALSVPPLLRHRLLTGEPPCLPRTTEPPTLLRTPAGNTLGNPPRPGRPPGDLLHPPSWLRTPVRAWATVAACKKGKKILQREKEKNVSG